MDSKMVIAMLALLYNGKERDEISTVQSTETKEIKRDNYLISLHLFVLKFHFLSFFFIITFFKRKFYKIKWFSILLLPASLFL